MQLLQTEFSDCKQKVDQLESQLKESQKKLLSVHVSLGDLQSVL